MEQPSEEYLIFIERNNELTHYGVKRRSGRYPWGSGDNPYQHGSDFLARVEQLRESGEDYIDPKTGDRYSGEVAIAKRLGMTTTDLRMQVRVAKHERRQLLVDRAKSLRDDGMSPTEIAREMGFKNESSVRALLNETTATNKNRASQTADILEKSIKEKKMLDVGAGVERELGCSSGTLKEALFILETRGYNVYGIGISQVTNKGKQTITTVLADKDVEYGSVYKNVGDIKSVQEYHSVDGGTTYKKVQYPASVDSKRVMINYAEDGGIDKDGVIELRRGVADLNLGNSHYAQVRILVDGTHYLKGMAMYADDLPDGIDIRFNTNKKRGTDKMKVLKEIHTEDPNNPFGASIAANGQSYYIGKDGKEKLSAINKLKSEGDWENMSKNLSSQFLSKQPMDLIKRQLNYSYSDYESQFKEIQELTNPTIRKKFLLDFADNCDGAASELKAAALPRQSTRVILPMPHLKDNEIYAPTYKDGEQVALVRYPHGGTFEIPILKVNNKDKKARSILDPTVIDAVGINPKVAERLSGADFDGDQVVVIPTNGKVKIKSSDPLKGLIGFDPKTAYSTEEKIVNGKKTYVNSAGIPVRIMSEEYKQKQMGVVSNLITDMTLGGAPSDEIARAVRHSMVVIDAAKHKLDYRQSEKDNGIAELKKKWQVHENEDGVVTFGGAATLLSKRGQKVRIPERQGAGRIDKKTGEVVYKESGRTYVDKKTGKTVLATQEIGRIYATKDLRTLSTGTDPEEAYATYGNKLKALANQARKEAANTPRSSYDKHAASIYAKEVASLNAKIDLAARNAPKERRALAITNGVVKSLIQDNPNMDKDDIKKASQIALENARASVGASGKKTKIAITDNEWKAIQSGAVSSSKLETIMKYADEQDLRQKATPRTQTTLPPSKITKLKAMSSSGFYTTQQIAEALGVSPSTVYKYMQ